MAISYKFVKSSDPQIEDDMILVFKDGAEVAHLQICGPKSFELGVEHEDGSFTFSSFKSTKEANVAILKMFA